MPSMIEVLSEAVLVDSRSFKVNKLFYYTLKEIFTDKFYNKMDSIIKNKIQIDEFQKDNNVVAYTQNGHIFVNAHAFYSKKPSDAVIYLVHEFVHLLQDLPYFPEIKRLDKQLYSLVKPNLTKPYSKFLTGKIQNIHSIAKEESLTYAIGNRSLDWSCVKPGVKEKYKEILEQSGLFNMELPWMKKIFKEKQS
jgi:hypothetical protein